MRPVISLATYIESYKLTREEVMKVINKEKDFFDNYIDWKNKDSETILSPKAIDKLGEYFNNDKKPEQVKLEEFMNEPKIEEEPKETEAKQAEPKPKKKTAPQDKAPRKKKAKNTITKQFIAEHGQCSEGNTKDLRMLLMTSGLYKAEQVALMNDDEVQGVISKDYYFIKSAEGTYIIRRSALTSIAADVIYFESN
jgi:hypothetical protein